MTGGEYAAGAAFFLATYAFVGVAAALVLRRLNSSLRGTERVLGWAILFTALLIGVHLVPAILAVLSRWSALVAALLVLAAALWADRRAPRRPAAAPDRQEPASNETLAGWLPAALGVFVVALVTLTYVRIQRAVAPSGVDMMSFHMPDVARWIQRGSVWQAPELVPEWAQGNYPHNGEFVLLSTVLPWRNDAFVRFIYLPYLALVGVGVYALARQLRVTRPRAVLAGALVLSFPTVARSTLELTKPDVVLWGAFAAGLVFLIRHWRTGARSDLLLAGLGLGLAFGSKWYGLPAVAVVLAVWALAWIRCKRPLGRGARELALIAGAVGVAGGFWLLRNWIVSGNPVFAVNVAPFGVTIFDAPPDPLLNSAGFSILHYLTDPGVIARDVSPAWWDAGSASLVVTALGALGALLLLVRARRRPERDAGLVAAGLLAAAVLVLAYAATPYSAFGADGAPDRGLTAVSVRYGVPALVVAVALAAWALDHLPDGIRRVAELGVVVAIAYSLRKAFEPSGTDLAKTLAALVVLAGVAFAAAWALRRAPRGRVAIAAGPAALVLAVLAGQAHQRQFNRERYLGRDAAVTWVQQNATAGQRIGVAGKAALGTIIPVYPMFGPRLRNDVQWLGPLVRGVVRKWQTPARYRGALQRAGFDLVMIERGSPPKPVVKEELWMRGTGYERVVRSPDLTLYRKAR